MIQTLIIARHGNTFGPGEEPRRVGGRTDLPLVARGRAQGLALGRALARTSLVPERVLCSRLSRARETAALALRAAGWALPLRAVKALNEIDYGPDENVAEWRVRARIGAAALAAWERESRPPPGWHVDPAESRRRWLRLAGGLPCVSFIVTSNGVARFAPGLESRPAKLATGAYGIITRAPGEGWAVQAWNVRP